jgi:hypothetical protein
MIGTTPTTAPQAQQSMRRTWSPPDEVVVYVKFVP